MRRLLLIATVTALALAKPEMYKEREDFQYSRSSSDEGSKAGYYGSQRGNMGGNYEKAHNMDGLAQNQMSGLVRQVEGELGDGFKTRTGSVYTAANSRGIYGSGNYDLSNLKGRNFEETDLSGTTQLRSSSMSQNAAFRGQSLSNSAAYSSSNSHAHSSGYKGHLAAGHSEQFMQTDDLQSADNLHSAHEYNYGNQAAQYSKTGFQSQLAYDQNNANFEHSDAYGLNTQTRSLSTPVRVVVKPRGRVAIPLTAQTYDAAGHAASSFDHSNINNDAELLSSNGQQINYRSSNIPKHESSYNYRKQWEKHDTQPAAIPLAIPTVNPFPGHSELYGENQIAQLENTQHQTNVDSYDSRASNSAFAANTKSAASRHRQHQTGYNAQHRSASLASNSNVYKMDTHASNADADNSAAIATDSHNLVELLNTKPKSYHSSYSYHKAWERQGDPYIIKPVSNPGSALQDGQISQQLTTGLSNHGVYKLHHSGSQYKQAHQSFLQDGVDCDCDEEGHIRVARSYNTNQEQQYENYQGQEGLGQHPQGHLEKLEDLGQQTQNHWDNSDNLGQQTQNQWGDLQDLGQQSLHQWDNLQNLGQETQNQLSNLQGIEQQTQEKFDKLEDLGQQTQSKWDKIEDLGQQAQNKWDKIEDLGQQSQNKWDKLEDLGQQLQTSWDNTQQQSQSKWDNLEDLNQQTQSNLERQIQPHGLEESKTDTNVEAFDNFEQQSQGPWNVFDKYSSQSSNKNNQNENNFTNNLSQKDQKEIGANIWTNIQQGQYESQQIQNTYFNIQNQTSMHSVTDNINKFEQNQYFHYSDIFQNQQSQNVRNLSETTSKHVPNKFWKQSEESINKNVQSLSTNGFGDENIDTQNNQQFPNNDKTETSATINEWYTNGNTGFNNTFWQDHYYDSTHSHTQTEQNVSPLSSLWDKLDGIAKETLTHDTDNDNTKKIDTQDSPYWTQEQTVSYPHFSHNPQDQNQKLPTEKPEESSKQGETEYHGKNMQPIDIGRGDIGPEDADSVHETLSILQIHKPNKTPQEIEALSMIKILNKTSLSLTTEKQNVDALSVLSIDEQKIIEELKHLMTNRRNEQISPTIPSMPSTNNIHQSRNNGVTETQFIHQNPIFDLQSTVNSGLAQENIGFEPAPQEQHNMEQQFEDFDKLELQSQSQLVDFGQQLQTAWQPQDNLEPVQYQDASNLEDFHRKPEQAQVNNNYLYQKPNSEQTYKKTEEIQATQNTNNYSQILTLPEPVTEKPGFWKSVGSKITNAKDKVFSWFGSGE